MHTQPIGPIQYRANAAPVDPDIIDEARRRAWIVHRGDRDSQEFFRLGSGHFSKVYALNDDLVLKVGGPGGFGYGKGVRGLSRYDYTKGGEVPVSDAWPDYIEWTASMKRRPSWAPRVHHIEQLTGRVYFAVMERLREPGYGHDKDHQAMRVPCRIANHVGNRVYGHRSDMHSRNFMTRYVDGGAHPVLTDPWCALGDDWDH